MNRSSSWELWAVALFGIWAYFHERGPAHLSAAPTAGHPAAGSWMGSAMHLIWTFADAVGVLFVLSLLALGGWLLVRFAMRRRRMAAMEAEEILLGPDDTASPEEMVAALDAIHSTLLTRYGGTAMGQLSWSFEIFREASGAIHFVIAAPYGRLRAVEDHWRAKYTNLRFRPWEDVWREWPYAQQISLARHWRHPIRMERTYANSVIETVVQALDRAEGAMHMQFLMTPLPVGHLTGQLKSSLEALEVAARMEHQTDSAQPSLGIVERNAVQTATTLLGRSAYRTEVRLGADTWDTVQRVYGAIAGSNADNQWRASTILVGKRLWERWLNLRVPSLFWFRPVILFSKPLATVIHVPSARLRVNSLQRMLIRRGPAPSAIPRDPRLALMRDETGTVGIPEGDRKFNCLFLGSQGGGKSTGLLNLFRVDATWKDPENQPKAIVLVDIGKDTGQRALGIAPTDRDLIWWDPADPECPWSINPLHSGGNPDAVANDVLEALTQVFGEEAIRARSREFLGNALLGVRDVLGEDADFTHMYRMLTDDTFRNDIIDRVQESHQKEYWQVTFSQAAAENPRFISEGLAAPRNKLDEVLRNRAVRQALTPGLGRKPLDLHEVITGRKILLVNLDKAKLGKSGARLLGIFVIMLLWHALENQTSIPEADRVPVSLILDEAQNFISEGFLDILAEGRAYGAQTTVAVRFLGEILSDRVIQGLKVLVQNLIIYQFELLEEAEVFMKRFMRTYSNMVNPNDEVQDAINFGADDFMRLPKHHTICRFMVDGSPQPAFLAQTIPWEGFYDANARVAHLARQPKVTSTDPEALPSATDETTPRPAVATAWPTMPPFDPSAPEDDEDDELPLTEETDLIPIPAASTPVATSDSEIGVAPESNPVPSAPAKAGGWELTATGRGEASADPKAILDLYLGSAAANQLLNLSLDALTGLLNQTVWARLIDQTSGDGHGILFCDLDGLKAINDTEGHTAGNDYIRRAAEALRSVVRTSDYVARIGGDEMAALIQTIDEPGLKALADRAREAFDQAKVAASLGVALQEPGEPLAAVVDRADAAMYTEKRQRKGTRTTMEAASVPSSKPSAPRKPIKVNFELLKEFAKVAETDLATVQAMGAQSTPTDMNSAIRWVLERKNITGKHAMQTLQTLLRRKAEDRLLYPIIDQLHVDLREFQDWLLVKSITASQVAAWLERHPDVKSWSVFGEQWEKEASHASNHPERSRAVES